VALPSAAATLISRTETDVNAKTCCILPHTILKSVLSCFAHFIGLKVLSVPEPTVAKM
jgi:hypothetical protein